MIGYRGKAYSPCSYLPGKLCRTMQIYAYVDTSPDVYATHVLDGWRRSGRTVYRPRCLGCRACESLRVPVDRFQPNRSQRRNAANNQGVVHLEIGSPSATREKVDLFAAFHRHRADTRGWNPHTDTIEDYERSFVDNPIPAEEWLYRIDGKLVGVGHVDPLPIGLSAVYFGYDPEYLGRGLGTWNVLQLIEETRRRGLPHLYLGYYVADCVSLSYKGNFRPHEILGPDGVWAEPGA